jgi:hypothetical protein
VAKGYGVVDTYAAKVIPFNDVLVRVELDRPVPPPKQKKVLPPNMWWNLVDVQAPKKHIAGETFFQFDQVGQLAFPSLKINVSVRH